MMPNYQDSIRNAVSENNKLKFLDTNAILSPFFKKEVLDAGIINVDKAASQSEEYFEFLFKEIIPNYDVFIPRVCANEIVNQTGLAKRALRNIELKSEENNYLVAQSKVYDILTNHIHSLAQDKLIDNKLRKRSEDYKIKTGLNEIPLNDIEIFLNSVYTSMNKDRDFEIWTRDSHFYSLFNSYQTYKNKIPNLAHMSIRQPYSLGPQARNIRKSLKVVSNTDRETVLVKN